MIISLKCKNCKGNLLGEADEFLFLCKECNSTYLLTDNGMKPISTFQIVDDEKYQILLPMYLFDISIDYKLFSTKRQEVVAQAIGNSIRMVVRGFSMIDPVYFGDIELETISRVNNREINLDRLTPKEKNFKLNIRPDVANRLLDYNFMRYFDRRADITGLKYNYEIADTNILFLKAMLNNGTILLSDLKKELPSFAFLSI